MMYKIKIRLLKIINKLLYLFNLNISTSLDKSKLIEILKKIKPYNVGYDLIRIGSSNDGGYLVPDLLNEISICFSPGVGNNIEFERQIINKGIKTFLADGTINREDIKLDNFNFLKKNLASYDSEMTITLENWVKEEGDFSDSLLLQMDIESSEYEVIHATSQDCLKKFKVLVIEFHYIEKINNHYFYKLFENSIKKLSLNFEILHIHPNNCQGVFPVSGFDLPTAIEITFLRKDLCKEKKDTKIPHFLDQKNIMNLPDVSFPKKIFN